MAALGAKLRTLGGGLMAHWCPACDSAHTVGITPPARVIWSFDGNTSAPTLSPSVKVQGGRVDGRFTSEFICHYFLRAGQIEFCGDSTHRLAGQTVPLPDWPDPQA